MKLPDGLARLFRSKSSEPVSKGEIEVAPFSKTASKPRPTAASLHVQPKRPATRTVSDIAPHSATIETLSRHTAETIVAASDTLCLSCLYFTRENLAALGNRGNIASHLEKLDPIFRAAITDTQATTSGESRFLVLLECRNELYAGVEAARLAAQIFGLLRDSKLPASGLIPLQNITDASARAIRAAGAAVTSGDAEAGQSARAALAEAEKMGGEFLALIPSLATYRSPILCRMIMAALYSVLVSAQMLTEVAVRLTLPNSPEGGIKELPLL